MAGPAATISRPPLTRAPLRFVRDDRLLRLTAAGDPAAFAVLYRRHHQALYRYVRTIVRDDHDAQDVVQTTMAKALGALGRGLPDAPARPWLFRIAHNEAIDVLRGRRPAEALDDVTVTGPPLESTVGQRGRLAPLVSDLGHLPERQRAALVLRELSGLSHEEIGAALGLSAGGAR